MSDVAIRVEGISKRYSIGKRNSGRTVREALSDTVAGFFRPQGPVERESEFWALRDVSFEVERGQATGIVGRNGAGKSTLLKILSRITEPTTGRAEIYGRVGSLLEVGTGFHPELSGRENVYLNGAILGMKRHEIDRCFDEIVDFAEVEKFIDTPVKHYSSGMYVRLAFAVAAHLEPEILIVDEVLAVGDVQFQKKCLGKMENIAGQGRTVLFVSHNLAAIEGLCSRAVLLQAGEVSLVGSVPDVVAGYLSAGVPDAAHARYEADEATTDRQEAYIVEASVESTEGYSHTGYPIGAPLEFKVFCLAPSARRSRNLALGIGVDDALGRRIVTLHSDTARLRATEDAASGIVSFRCHLEDLALAPGTYQVKLSLERGSLPLDVIERALYFEILDSDYYRLNGKKWQGVVLCKQSWSVTHRTDSGASLKERT